MKAQVNSDVAVLATKLEYTQQSVEEVKTIVKDIAQKMDAVENRTTAVESKVTGMAVLQSVFTILASSIAAFLGGRRA